MNKKNNKLALNKQIVANLNGQDMEVVKGGVAFTLNLQWCELFFQLATYAIEMTVKECFSGDARGICKTDGCTVSQNCGITDNMSCYGGSCGKCG